MAKLKARPLSACISEYKDYVYVHCKELNLYTDGKDEDEALKNLINSAWLSW